MSILYNYFNQRISNLASQAWSLLALWAIWLILFCQSWWDDSSEHSSSEFSFSPSPSSSSSIMNESLIYIYYQCILILVLNVRHVLHVVSSHLLYGSLHLYSYPLSHLMTYYGMMNDFQIQRRKRKKRRR